MDTAAVYAHFAGSQARNGGSPTYEDWALGVAADDDVRALLDTLPEPKRQPNLLFAAARLAGAPSGRWAAVRTWLLTAWPDVEREMRARATQTNEPRRCATLVPTLAAIDGPVALVEVGASAGLCLYPDRYSYLYTSPDGVRTRLDPADGPSEVLLPCDIEGPVPAGLPSAVTSPVPARLPDIVWRAGIDLNPLDVRDPGDLAWLEALVWPEHADRVETLRAAARVVAADPPRLVRADLLTGVADLVAAAPAEATVVVQSSAVLYYLTPAELAQFTATMEHLRRTRGVVWLSNEGWTVLPDVARKLPADADPQFILARDGEPVALTDPHGRSVRLL
ncbi:DUF2332 domain-containing protein [Promicromonospora sukumoe]|uniref:DUF2332 domain-containing protein n=1 Tax=Promicromonospora sukumoe TaxID=88382 RepID=A0A7W3PF21_9MICO|nr:DUF2332 domain-containing protein [Promicromonospora sukumoe]MBA8809488.1 hypothetical protein [Promicromonospora sukumoe]